MEGMAPFPLDISPWGAMGGLFMPKIIRNFALQKVQLSENVHHWTPDDPYGSRDFKFPTNVPMKLSSFDVGSLIASIFGKLKLPSQSSEKTLVICSLETQDLHSGSTRSAFWKCKICILDTQDLYCDQTRILIPVCSQHTDLMSHTSQEWLNGVLLLFFHNNSLL